MTKKAYLAVKSRRKNLNSQRNATYSNPDRRRKRTEPDASSLHSLSHLKRRREGGGEESAHFLTTCLDLTLPVPILQTVDVRFPIVCYCNRIATGTFTASLGL